MLQLGHGNDDRQPVDEPQHHRVRDHAHQFAEPEQPERHHDQAAQQHCGEEVLHAVLHHQRDNHHRHRPGRAGHHAGTAAEQRGEGANDEGAIQAH